MSQLGQHPGSPREEEGATSRDTLFLQLRKATSDLQPV